MSEYKHQKKEVLHTSNFLNLVEEDIELPTGIVVQRLTVEHSGAVVVIPILDTGHMVMVKQYRHAVQKHLLEFPAGTLEQGETPLDCAKRELAEEIGQEAAIWKDLGLLHPAPGFCNEVQHVFIASNLSPVESKPDEDEILEIFDITPAEFDDMILRGQITDAKSIALFYKAAVHIKHQS